MNDNSENEQGFMKRIYEQEILYPQGVGKTICLIFRQFDVYKIIYHIVIIMELVKVNIMIIIRQS